MPVFTAWKHFNRSTIEALPNKRGMYEIACVNKTVIYRGGSDSDASGVKGRLINHLIHNKFPTARFFRCRWAGVWESGIELEGKAAAKHEAVHGKKPKYNPRSPKVNKGLFDF